MVNHKPTTVVAVAALILLCIGVAITVYSRDSLDNLCILLRGLFTEDVNKHSPEYWLKLAHSSDVSDKRKAIHALTVICNESAIAELLRMSGDVDPHIGYSAHDALNCVGPQHRDAASAVSKFLEDSDVNRRLAALFALRRIGKSASEVGPDLMRALDRSAGPDEKAEILLTLAYVRGTDAVPLLKEALEDKSEPIRAAARRGLAVVRRESQKPQ